MLQITETIDINAPVNDIWKQFKGCVERTSPRQDAEAQPLQANVA